MSDHSHLLEGQGISAAELRDLIARTLAEDLNGGLDVTTVATVPAQQRSELLLVARASGVVAGLPIAAAVFEALGDVEVHLLASDGDAVDPGDVLLRALGPTVLLLTGERSALNFLGHLSGVATATQQWAAALADSNTRVRDTRKTTPGLRKLEKYAVRCGGGVNHRMFLSDAALVKDNHVLAAGGVAAAFAKVRQAFPDLPVEVEVDTLAQLQEAIDAGADLVMLDNFTIAQMREAVLVADGRVQLEASGGLTLADAPAVATTGVDFVAVGALTHSAAVLDIGADLIGVSN